MSPRAPQNAGGMLQIVFARLPAVQTFSTVIFFSIIVVSLHLWYLRIRFTQKNYHLCQLRGYIYMYLYT